MHWNRLPALCTGVDHVGCTLVSATWAAHRHMSRGLYTDMGQVGCVSEHMGWVRNVVLMNVYFGSGKPQGVRISGRGARWADEGNAGVSLLATQGRGGRILSQQGGFQVCGKGNKGSKGSKGIIVYITYLSYVYNGMNAAVNDTSCIFA